MKLRRTRRNRMTIGALAAIYAGPGLIAQADTPRPMSPAPEVADAHPEPVQFGSVAGATHAMPVAGLAAGATTTTNGSLIVIGQTFAGRVSGNDFTMDIGTVVPLTTTAGPPSCTLAPAPVQAGVQKMRMPSIDANDTGYVVAYRVTFDDLPGAYAGLIGQQMWIGPPFEVCENSGQSTPPPGGCGPAPGAATPSIMVAELQCDPFYADLSTWSEVHLFSPYLVPDATYSIQAIDESCPTGDESGYSTALTMTTSIWGDLVGSCAVQPCEPPDGGVDITRDVTAVLDKFKNLATGPSKPRADIEPDLLDQLINISDVTFTLDAFRGEDYPFTPAPFPCAP